MKEEIKETHAPASAEVKLAIVATHPVQYNAPWFQLIAAEGIGLKVFYTWKQREQEWFDEDFKREVKWDIPLLEGYDFIFVENTAERPGNKHFSGIICPGLNESIENWGASHLLIFGWNFHAHWNAMKYFKGRIPVLFRGDSTLLDERGGFKDSLRRVVLKWIYRKIDYALYVGNSNQSYYLRHGVRKEQLVYCPHAVDNDRFAKPDDFSDESILQLKREVGMKTGNKTVLFVGKFERKKDPQILLDALKELRKRGLHDVNLLFVGNGVLEDELKNAGEKLQDVFFLPFQNQSRMPLIYRLGDVLVLPSVGPGETWGLVVNEAMATGLKCVVSDKCGCASDLGVYSGNFIFRAGDLSDLVNRLFSALSSDEMDNTEFLKKWNFSNIVGAVNSILEK